MGSVKNIGDKVMHKYMPEEDDYLHGTVIGQVDEKIAKVEVVLEGRRRGTQKSILEIPFDELIPCI